MDCKLQKPGLHTETLETEHFKVEVMRNDGKVMAMRILRDDQWLPVFSCRQPTTKCITCNKRGEQWPSLRKVNGSVQLAC